MAVPAGSADRGAASAAGAVRWRLLYSGLLYVALPVLIARVALLGLREPGYWRDWRQRLGFVPRRRGGGRCLWVHAVSVGEVHAARPIIERLCADDPALEVVLTTTTPSGAATAEALLGERVRRYYFPYDLPDAVNRFLRRARPDLLALMETELWPNLLHACKRAGVPAVLVNGRLSRRSLDGYRRVLALMREAAASLAAVAAQSADDAARLTAIGVPASRVAVTGSVKFDLAPAASLREEAAALRRRIGVERPVWIGGSTHEGEEAILLEAHAAILAERPDAVLILAPRHPRRGAEVAAAIAARGLRLARRSSGDDRTLLGVQVYLLDTLGELGLHYAVADVAFVGGSLVPTGGHNVLEPAALGVPVLVGPHTHNFREIVEWMLARGAAAAVRDGAGLAGAVAALLADPARRAAMGEAGEALVADHRGAVGRVVEVMRPLLAPD